MLDRLQELKKLADKKYPVNPLDDDSEEILEDDDIENNDREFVKEYLDYAQSCRDWISKMEQNNHRMCDFVNQVINDKKAN